MGRCSHYPQYLAGWDIGHHMVLTESETTGKPYLAKQEANASGLRHFLGGDGVVRFSMMDKINWRSLDGRVVKRGESPGFRKAWDTFGEHSLQCSTVLSHSVTFSSLQPRGLQPARLLWPWSFPGKCTETCCHFICQGISVEQALFASPAPAGGFSVPMPLGQLLM